MLKHFVEFSCPGAFFSEYSCKEIPERNPEVVSVPNRAFAYRFYDQEQVFLDGELLKEEPKNYSAYTYFGKSYTIEEVKQEFPEAKNLIWNSENNGWNKAVKTICGNWQPLMEGDIVIEK